jgi:hypothetical protein
MAPLSPINLNEHYDSDDDGHFDRQGHVQEAAGVPIDTQLDELKKFRNSDEFPVDLKKT